MWWFTYSDGAQSVLTRRIGYRSSNKMPVAVKKAIEHAAAAEGGLTDAEAKAFITKLEREGRLFEECWS
jgi:hypothetical protein